MAITGEPRIKIGVLQPNAKPLNIGVSGARRGVAEFGGGSRTGVIVKSASPLELAVECFCALLAQDLGMRAPNCAIVAEGTDWLFASVDTGYPNLAQAFRLDPLAPNPSILASIAAELAGWMGIGRLLAFDVLIKNADRNVGNLLLDGSDFVLIDHARSLDAFPYPDTQKIFQLMKLSLNASDLQAARTKAIGAALTFNGLCATLPSAELDSHTLTTPFAPNFEVLIRNRLTSISTTVNSNL